MASENSTEQEPVASSGAALSPGELRKTVLLRALHKRCPQCGRIKVFRGYARLLERCPECGHVFRREQGAQTGSMYLTAAVTQVFAASLAGGVFVFSDWSVAFSLGVSVPIVFAFCLWFLPFSQSFWCGVEYLTDVHNQEEWVRPRA